jgi:dephospho-CoA kinase
MASPSPSDSACSEGGANRTGTGGRYRIGLTGGIGSGKSLIADELARLGAYVVDADVIAHRITAAGGRAIESIAAKFGPQFIGADGALERRRMRDLVFRDASARAALEQILHPMIRAEADAIAVAAPAHCPYIVFAIPLLIESGSWRDRFDRVLVIDCPVEMQIERVTRRSQLDESAVLAIIANQAERAVRLDAADDVLVNAGSVIGARQRAARLHELYARLGHGRAAARATL